MDPRGPAGERGREQRPDGLSGVQQSQELWLPEHLVRERREKHDRHGEQHRDQVDDVGAQQVSAAEGVAQALLDPAEAGRLGLADVRVAAHRGVEHGGDEQADDVDEEAPARAERRHQHAADRRADEDARLHAEAAECVGGHDLVVPNGAREQRLARRALESRRGGQKPRHQEDLPEPRVG